MIRLAVTDPAAAHAFIERLAVPPTVPAAALEKAGDVEQQLPTYDRDEPQAVVVGSQIAEFAAEVPAEMRPAITNSFLLAQVVANKQVGQGQAGTKAWYDKYNEVLSNTGWIVESNATSTQEVSGKGLELHKEILPVIAAVLGPAVAAATIVMKALDGLSNMDNDSKWIALFDRQSQRASANQFQVSYAAAPEGKPLISIACFELTASRSITQVLFFKFSQSEAELRYFASRLSMNPSVFDHVKSAVEAKISTYVDGYIASLDI